MVKVSLYTLQFWSLVYLGERKCDALKWVKYIGLRGNIFLPHGR